MKRVKIFFVLVIFGGFFSINSAKSQIKTVREVSVRGEKAPKMQKTIGDQKKYLILKTFKREKFDLEQEKGKIILVNFWANWCGICRKELNLLNRIQVTKPEIKIIGISIDEEEDREKAWKIARNLRFINGFAYDIEETNFEIPDAVPTSYLIDKTGRIRKILEGGFGEAEIKKEIEKLQN